MPGGQRHYDTFQHHFRAAEGDPDQWSQREIEDTGEFIAAAAAAVFSEIANSSDRTISAEL